MALILLYDILRRLEELTLVEDLTTARADDLLRQMNPLDPKE